MLDALICLLAFVLLCFLLFFEKKENRGFLLPTKVALSSLFVFTAVLQPHMIPRYYYFLLLGLILCLCGDVFLALPEKRMFLFGLISFLMGHISYLFAFFHVARTTESTWIGALVVLLFSSGVYYWLLPHLGSMKKPVLLYVVVISMMVAGAWTVLVDSDLTRSGRVVVFAGALSFYFSDLFVARDRFIEKEFLNRLIGLPLYYAGQFLLAFSVGSLCRNP